MAPRFGLLAARAWKTPREHAVTTSIWLTCARILPSERQYTCSVRVSRVLSRINSKHSASSGSTKWLWYSALLGAGFCHARAARPQWETYLEPCTPKSIASLAGCRGVRRRRTHVRQDAVPIMSCCHIYDYTTCTH